MTLEAWMVFFGCALHARPLAAPAEPRHLKGGEIWFYGLVPFELAFERVFVLLAESRVVINEVSGDPCDAGGLEGSARVDDVDKGLPEVGFRDFVVADLEACFGAPFDDGRRGVDYGEAFRFYPHR